VLAQQAYDLAWLRVSAELGLLEHGYAVSENLEPAAAARLELDVYAWKVLRDLGRQTGGPGLVVSKRAVFDRDGHDERER
jgi:hypothetical protein